MDCLAARRDDGVERAVRERDGVGGPAFISEGDGGARRDFGDSWFEDPSPGDDDRLRFDGGRGLRLAAARDERGEEGQEEGAQRGEAPSQARTGAAAARRWSTFWLAPAKARIKAARLSTSASVWLRRKVVAPT